MVSSVSRPWRARAACVAAAVLGAGLLSTGSAQASVFPCNVSGHVINCTTVTGIDPGSYLQVRQGPGYGYPNQWGWPRLNNGDRVGLACWTTGDGAADNSGYRYWMRIDNGIAFGYVNDWYLSTGGPGSWQQIIRQC